MIPFGVVSNATLAIADADGARLPAVISEQLEAVVGARCTVELGQALERVGEIVFPLRARGRDLGRVRIASERPLTAEQHDAAGLLAAHAAIALVNASAHSASATRLVQLFESPLIGIVVGDLQGRISTANNALLEIVGYTREEVLSEGFAWRSLTPVEYREVDARARDQLMTTGIGELREKELIDKRGRRVPVLVGSKMVDAHECISFVLDLTERKRAEATLESLQHEHSIDLKFRGLLEAAPDAMVAVDANGVIVVINEQVEQMFGYSRDQLLGQAMEVLIPEGSRAGHRAYLADYLREPRPRRMGAHLDLFGRRKDGSAFPIEVSLGPVHTDAGLLVCSAIRDVTERRHAEQQRARLAAIVAASADAIVGKTLEGVVTSWNPGAEALFGYTASEMVGKSIMAIVPPELEAEEMEILSTLAHGVTKHFETVRRRKDGTRIDVAVTTSPIADHRGQVVGISKVARDITELKRSQAAEVRARVAAEDLNRELETFSYSVAHDLRTPLRGINGFAQLLHDVHGDKLDAEALEWLGEILLGTSRMGELIDGLLSLARVSRSELARGPVDLSALAHSIATQLAQADPSRAVAVAIENGLEANMDARLARSLLDNLVGNAWKFTAKRSDARIELGARDDAFFVRDNGAGFDMAHAAKLFVPFQRLHRAADFTGTGIGLATVHRIVQRHGGRVWAEGAVNDGATFYFSIPMKGRGA